MIRRDFCKTSLALAGLALSTTRAQASPEPAATDELHKAPGLTQYVSEFIVNTKYEGIPENVIALGKKTILDGFGLALAGSASTAGPLVRRYVESLGACSGSSTAVGTTMKVHPRFAALANGVSIHADG